MGITMPYKPTWQARRTAFGLDGVTPCALEGIVLRNGVLEGGEQMRNSYMEPEVLPRRCPRCRAILRPELTDLACFNCGWRLAGVLRWPGFFSGLQHVGLATILRLIRNRPGDEI